jgi:cytochrome c peroxidase
MDPRPPATPRRATALVLFAVVAGAASLASAAPDGPPAPARPGSKADARVELGRRLFFDPRVSRAGMRSCADCHDPEHGFSDRDRRSVDDRGRTRRHSQTLVDGYANPTAHWDGAFRRVGDLVTARVTLAARGRVSNGHEFASASPRTGPGAEPKGSDRAFADGGGSGLGASGPGVDPVPNVDIPDRPDEGGGYDASGAPPRDDCSTPPPTTGGGASDGNSFRKPDGEEAPSTPGASAPPSTPSAPTPDAPSATAPPATTPSTPPAATGEGQAPAPTPNPQAPRGQDPRDPDRKPEPQPAPAKVDDPFVLPSTLPPEKEAFMDAELSVATLPYADQALEAAGRYREGFVAAYGTPQVTIQRIAEAIESYCHTLVTGTSAYDRFADGDEHALSAAGRRGLDLFRGRAGCAACHDMTGPRAAFTDYRFHNTGIVWKGISAKDDVARRELAERDGDGGVAMQTGRPRDRRTFKTPTLRDVARRGPYMHDGSLRTLEAVVKHYAAGAEDPDADKRAKGVELSAQDVADLVTFLRSLDSDTRPGLAANAWRERAAITKLRFVDDAGKPLAGLGVRILPDGDRLPGAVEADAKGRDFTTDDDGRISYDPPRWTHVQIVLADGLKPASGTFVPDTCREATIRVPVRGQVAMFLTLPAGVAPPAVVEARHETSLLYPDRRFPRTVFRRETAQEVGGKTIALYRAPFRTDLPTRVTIALPMRAWGLDALHMSLDPAKELRLDLGP